MDVTLLGMLIEVRAAAAIECITANGRHTAGDGHRDQLCTVFKSIIIN